MIGVDNVVVLIIRIMTGNSDIVNMYKCSKSKTLLFMPNWSVYVQLGHSRRMCKSV